MASFGDRLRYLREESGMSQEELAKKLNVHKGTISNWETGRRFPDEGMLLAIRDLFDCTFDFLLGRSDSKNGVIIKEDKYPEILKNRNIDYIEIAKMALNNEISEQDAKDILKIIKKNNQK